MRRAIAIRAGPGLSVTLAAGRAAGLEIAGWPLFELRACDWQPPDPARIDALLIGSANAIRFGGPALGRLRQKPVHAVGDATAQAARAAGFAVASIGDGGLQKLLGNLATGPLRLLRVAGAEHIPLVPPEGIVLETRIAYETAPLPMPEAAAAALREPAVVLLHSAAAARHFAGECARLDIPRASVELAALGPRIAAAAGEGWARVRWAEVPREAALLALAGDMCH